MQWKIKVGKYVIVPGLFSAIRDPHRIWDCGASSGSLGGSRGTRVSTGGPESSGSSASEYNRDFLFSLILKNNRSSFWFTSSWGCFLLQRATLTVGAAGFLTTGKRASEVASSSARRLHVSGFVKIIHFKYISKY